MINSNKCQSLRSNNDSLECFLIMFRYLVQDIFKIKFTFVPSNLVVSDIQCYKIKSLHCNTINSKPISLECILLITTCSAEDIWGVFVRVFSLRFLLILCFSEQRQNPYNLCKFINHIGAHFILLQVSNQQSRMWLNDRCWWNLFHG